MKSLTILLATLVLGASLALGSEFNYKHCLQKYNDGLFGPNVTGGTDNRGQLVDLNQRNATAFTYRACRELCGTGREAFRWTMFSKQFTAWLLPWLALLSQLPYGSSDTQDNLIAMALMLGSPVLATYSLMLTVLGGAYARKVFDPSGSKERKLPIHASYLLTSMFQFPIRVSPVGEAKMKEKWWKKLGKDIDCEHTWSLAALASILWVIIAYVFTIADSFTSEEKDEPSSNGPSIGCIWLWLLPVVIGWLQISPKCDHSRVGRAIEDSQTLSEHASRAAVSNQHPTSSMALYPPFLECPATIRDEGYKLSSISMDIPSSDKPKSEPPACMPFKFELLQIDQVALPDERRTPPIYNYARFLPWMHCVDRAAQIYADPSFGENKIADGAHIQSAIVHRMLVASLAGLALQWLTSGSAIIIAIFTPTTGLGCRSGSYLVYAVVSTIVWLLIVISNIIAYYSLPSLQQDDSGRFKKGSTIGTSFAISLCRFAKLIAVLNSIWIIAVCMFVFSKTFSNCFCNGSVLGRGSSGAYVVIDLLPEDMRGALQARAGGVAMSTVTAFLFIGFLMTFGHIPSKKAELD